MVRVWGKRWFGVPWPSPEVGALRWTSCHLAHTQTSVLTALEPVIISRVLATPLGRGGRAPPREADPLLPTLCPLIDTCAER